MSQEAPSPFMKLRIVTLSIFGAIAVICFLVSLLVEGSAGTALRTVASIAGGVCAVIGVSFAITKGTE